MTRYLKVPHSSHKYTCTVSPFHFPVCQAWSAKDNIFVDYLSKLFPDAPSHSTDTHFAGRLPAPKSSLVLTFLIHLLTYSAV